LDIISHLLAALAYSERHNCVLIEFAQVTITGSGRCRRAFLLIFNHG
jgi:hypothetical protein